MSIDTRRLLSSTALYGLADVAVMAVGGFLLLPLYTRTLTQGEFGSYVAVRASIDIFTYVLHFGLPSAVARLYFDHRKAGQQHEYVSSIVTAFLVGLAVISLLLWWRGPEIWNLMSPAAPVVPYLPFSVAIAAMGFFSAIAVTWLRMEGKAMSVVGLQLGASATLAACAGLSLLTFDLHLPGLMLSLLASALVPALALPVLLGRRFRFTIRREHLTGSLRYAAPILVGYIAYFFLNRISTLLLQRHVSAESLAVFGLAQQLSMIVAIACTSFGSALQPSVFSADPEHVNAILDRAGKILTMLMTGVTCLLMLFAKDLIALVAPQSYNVGSELLLLLIVANFTTTFTLLSDTALLYHRRPNVSVAVSIFGALMAAALGLWLIPLYHALGAGISLAGAFTARMLLSQWMAYRVTGRARFGTMFMAMAGVSAMAFVAATLHSQPLTVLAAAGAKLTVGLFLLSAIYLVHRKS